MKIHDVLPKNGILIDLKTADKRDALTQTATYMASLYNLKAPDLIVQKILAREAEMSTGIGYGIAIPHARIDGIDRLYMIAARTADGIEFDALDEQPVQLLFMMISPPNTSADHTHLLSSLSRIMSYQEVRESLLAVKDADAFLNVIINGESKYVE